MKAHSVEEIVEAVVTEGLGRSTWSESYPEAFEALGDYKADIVFQVKRLMAAPQQPDAEYTDTTHLVPEAGMSFRGQDGSIRTVENVEEDVRGRVFRVLYRKRGASGIDGLLRNCTLGQWVTWARAATVLLR